MGQDVREVREKVLTIIAKQVKRDASSLSGADELSALGIESLDIVEIIFSIEEVFDIEVPYNANDTGAFNMHSVDDVVRSVESMLRAT